MWIYENGVMREATAEEIAEAARQEEKEKNVIVQMTAEEVLKLLAPKLVIDIPDETAIHMVAYYPKWADRLNKENPQQEGEDILVGERLQDNDKLWKCITTHKALANWKPENSPSLFVEVSIEEWPEWVQPVGSTDAYPLGAHVSHNGKHWESIVADNVWEPGVYGWKEV